MTTTIKRGRPKEKTIDRQEVVETKTPAVYEVKLNFNGKKITYHSNTLDTLFTWITETLKTKLLISVKKEAKKIKDKYLFIPEARRIIGNKVARGIFIAHLEKELK